MGLRFRKSVNMGPVRVNFSKSGVGVSAGVKGYRVTKRADGKTQTTASIPGTGISYVNTSGGKKKEKEPSGCLVWLVILGLLMLIGCISSLTGCGYDTPKAPSLENAETVEQQPAAETEQPAEETKPEAKPEPQPEPKPEPKPAPKPATLPVVIPAEQPKQEPVSAAVIGNKNSEVYHELHCDSVKNMKDKNKANFESREAAEAAGYRPCKNCH